MAGQTSRSTRGKSFAPNQTLRRVFLLRRRRNLRRVPTTEEKPEVPFSRVLREIRDPFWEPLLRGFASGIGHLAVQNRVPAKLEIGQKTLVCCCPFFFGSPVFEQVDGRTAHFSEKRR